MSAAFTVPRRNTETLDAYDYADGAVCGQRWCPCGGFNRVSHAASHAPRALLCVT